MWIEACELLDRAERLHRQFFQLGRLQARGPTWEPPVDVFETDRDLWILVALPGVEPDQVEVVIDTDTLIVAGERRIPVASRAVIHRLEIPYGRFERRIRLPSVPVSVGRRELLNGCLLLTLRKQQ
jgi:HSP20 family molecular chaperone IbpA